MAVSSNRPDANDADPGSPGVSDELFEQEVAEAIRDRQPRFLDAVLGDARVAAAFHGKRSEFRSRVDGIVQALRLMIISDAFLAQAAYRAKARLQALGVPLLPHLANRLAITLAQISIGGPVVMHPGVFIPHGQVVVHGLIEIRPGAVLQPWITIGGLPGDPRGPVIAEGAIIGTGAKVFGAVRIGSHARVGLNSVVLDDVPDGATVVGMPARVYEH